MNETVPICVTYTHEFADFAALQAIVSRDARVKRLNLRWWIPPLGAFAVTAVILKILDVVVTADGNELPIALAGALMFYGLLALIVGGFRKAQSRNLFSLTFRANQTVSHCLSDDGISGDFGKVREFFSWPSIIRQEATADHLLLFICPLQGVALPRRAFASTEDFNAAIAFAKERVTGP